MVNAIPVFGWILSAVGAIGLSVPLWFFWTYCELGKQYFYFLPERYYQIPFWDIFGLVVVCSILNFILVPKISNTTNNNNNGSK